jgi:ABC-type glycerol-3-phosphate transport system substrate-binding protein
VAFDDIKSAAAVLLMAAAGGLAACSTVTLKGSEEEPIVVNLNVKIDQEVRVRLDKDIEDLIAENPDIF